MLYSGLCRAHKQQVYQFPWRHAPWVLLAHAFLYPGAGGLYRRTRCRSPPHLSRTAAPHCDAPATALLSYADAGGAKDVKPPRRAWHVLRLHGRSAGALQHFNADECYRSWAVYYRVSTFWKRCCQGTVLMQQMSVASNESWQILCHVALPGELCFMKSACIINSLYKCEKLHSQGTLPLALSGCSLGLQQNLKTNRIFIISDPPPTQSRPDCMCEMWRLAFAICPN